MFLKLQSNRLDLPLPMHTSFGEDGKRSDSPVSVLHLKRKRCPRVRDRGRRRTSEVASDDSGIGLEVRRERRFIFWVCSCGCSPRRHLDCFCKFGAFLAHRMCCGCLQ
ncbi:hypothetical protein CEXT_45091 [Caerostris extrusa]|uniref:Uncharacterized protein n=1 Tax=Caerostris extrusa TaxID=172846 RepID=A0AAV4UR62_CAEEX|nr:hypothetical protein CEXT_45091 [Caerostris extrusa]